MEVKDQMFSQMGLAARQRLEGKDPAQLAQRAGGRYCPEEKAIYLASLARQLRIQTDTWQVTPALPGWQELVVLHYLDLADGTPLTGRPIPFSQMASGMVRGGGVDRQCEQAFAALDEAGCQALADRCAELGAVALESRADAAWQLPFLPRFPVTVQLWLPDEEFPASGRMALDASADHYLTIEDAVTVAQLLLELLTAP